MMSVDEQAGIDWWNALSVPERAGWLAKARSAVPADAWAAFQLAQPKYSYVVHPRPAELGGGWRLRLLENGEEVGGGVYPPVAGIEGAEDAAKAAHDDASLEGAEWVASRIRT